jgi:hypothetical protein
MATVNDTAASASRRAQRLKSHSAAARRHLRQTYGMEERLRAILDSIPYVSIGGQSCGDLGRALLHVEQAVNLLASVERREIERYEALASAGA